MPRRARVKGVEGGGGTACAALPQVAARFRRFAAAGAGRGRKRQAAELVRCQDRGEVNPNADAVCLNLSERLFQLLETVAGTNSTILITGETGTGKEVVARALHHNSDPDRIIAPVSGAFRCQRRGIIDALVAVVL